MSKRVNPNKAVTHYLTDFFHQYLPISKYLNLRVHEYDGEHFSLAMDLAPSINDKLTAFGGSLFSLCVMNCWGMCYLQARERGIDPNMVVSHSEIDYLAPVDDEIIIATCRRPDEMDWPAFFTSFAERGKARATLHSEIICRGKTAVRFTGQYAVIGVNTPATAR